MSLKQKSDNAILMLKVKFKKWKLERYRRNEEAKDATNKKNKRWFSRMEEREKNSSNRHSETIKKAGDNSKRENSTKDGSRETANSISK